MVNIYKNSLLFFFSTIIFPVRANLSEFNSLQRKTTYNILSHTIHVDKLIIKNINIVYIKL
jgi:hypothetical protein